MKRPLVVTAASGIATCTGWWSMMRVEGGSLVLANPAGEGDSETVLVVASLSGEGEAQALLRTVTDRLSHGAKSFDVRVWPSLAKPERILEDGG